MRVFICDRIEPTRLYCLLANSKCVAKVPLNSVLLFWINSFFKKKKCNEVGLINVCFYNLCIKGEVKEKYITYYHSFTSI